MSKRLQIIMPDDEYRAIASAALTRGRPIAHVVRESLRRTLSEEVEAEPAQRIAAVLRFARFSGPTGDIEAVLQEIEQGRGVS